MRLAMIGLGRMGTNVAERLLQAGHEVVAYNRTRAKTDEVVKEGAVGAYSLPEVIEKLPHRMDARGDGLWKNRLKVGIRSSRPWSKG
jgi:6-phosphogluconate dehydrogenase (decarboxylating)